MVTVYCPEELPLLDGLGNARAHCPRVRAATTSVLVYAVMNHVTGLLEKADVLGRNAAQSRDVSLRCFYTGVLVFFRVFPEH